MREPANVVPSTCGMAEVSACLKANWKTKDFLHVLGESVASRLAVWADRQIDFVKRRDGTATRVLCLNYRDVVADPLAAVDAVYAAAKRPLADDVRAQMERHLADNGQHRHGRPNYSLAKFGQEDLSRFRDYEAAFLAK